MSASTNWEDVYRTQTARIAELERENARLQQELDSTCNAREMAKIKLHAERISNANDRLVVENVRLRMDLDASCNAEELRQVRAENAALLEDKARLEELERENAALQKGVDTARRDLGNCIHERWDECLVERAYFALKAIAARKEAHP